MKLNFKKNNKNIIMEKAFVMLARYMKEEIIADSSDHGGFLITNEKCYNFYDECKNIALNFDKETAIRLIKKDCVVWEYLPDNLKFDEDVFKSYFKSEDQEIDHWKEFNKIKDEKLIAIMIENYGEEYYVRYIKNYYY